MSLDEQINDLLKQYAQSDNSPHNVRNRVMQVKGLCAHTAIVAVTDIEMDTELKFAIVNKLEEAFGEDK